MDIMKLINQMAVLFSLMLFGVGAYKWGMINEEVNKKLSKLLIHIGSPAVIFSSILDGGPDIKKEKMVSVFIAAIALFVFIPLLANILVRVLRLGRKENSKNVYLLLLGFSNLGFMGIPIISSIYGATGVLYLAVFIIIFNITLNSYGYYIACTGGDTDYHFQPVKLINPPVVSGIAAIILYIAGVKLPFVFAETASLLGGLTTPLSMLLIGYMLAISPVREVLMNKELYLFTFLRLFIIPITVSIVFGIFIKDEILLGVAVLIGGLPSAANNAMLFTNVGNSKEASLASKGTFFSTLFSVLTIPIMIFLTEQIRALIF